MTTEQVSRLLPIGTVIAIREPYLSVDHQSRAGPCAGKADVGIRVDTPTDILIREGQETSDVQWRETIEMIPAAKTDWMRACSLGVGEKHVESDKVRKEVERLIELDRPGEAHRVLCRAKTAGSAVDGRTEANVLYRLDSWAAAAEAFARLEQGTDGGSIESDEEAAANFASNVADLTAKQARLRCELRISQARRGLSTSDMCSVYFATARGVDYLDTSDYIGPVKVQDVPGAGRGLITTRAVSPGELLLTCKAVCATYPDDDDCKGSPLLRLNLENGVVSTTSQVLAQTRLIHAIVGECSW